MVLDRHADSVALRFESPLEGALHRDRGLVVDSLVRLNVGGLTGPLMGNPATMVSNRYRVPTPSGVMAMSVNVIPGISPLKLPGFLTPPNAPIAGCHRSSRAVPWSM